MRQEWKKVLEADPAEHDAWFGYAELCLFLGDEAEYRRARQDLLRRFAASSDPGIAERTARAILLSPAAEDELQAAVALAERAVAAKTTTAQWIYPYFLFAQGLAEYRQGRFDSAIAAPRLVIAMAQYRKGQEEEARAMLAGAIAGFDWRMAQVISRDHWIWHVLRREAESMILSNLAAFVDGKYQPQDNDERLAFLGACQFMNRTRATARLYADAFAAAPSLADDLGAGHRYNAARAAAQAGCGHGADATGRGEEERTRLREQARQWLRADLAARARAFDAGSTATRGAVRMALTRWRNDPDLAGLREPSELNNLPADERKECLALWAEVAALLARTQK